MQRSLCGTGCLALLLFAAVCRSDESHPVAAQTGGNDCAGQPDKKSDATHVVFVVGPASHAAGTHEAAAGARLMEHCLEHGKNISGIEAQVFYEWPHDEAVLDRAKAIVFGGDTFPPMRFANSAEAMAKLTKMMNRGCGLVCVHYATALRGTDVEAGGDHPLLHWMGGYFATATDKNRSLAAVVEATIIPAPGPHPILRGWREFAVTDEPYFNNFFGANGMAANVTPLAVSMLPRENPKREVVAWCVERKEGGRGVAVTMPHFFGNWRVDEVRKMILNGIVWSAGLEVPAEGVQTEVPDLASFKPEALEPQPRKAAPAKKAQ